MLSKEKIEKNYTKFVETGLATKSLTPELIEVLGPEMVIAPATTSVKLFGAFPGGLIDHILNVTKSAIELQPLINFGDSITKEEIIKVAFIQNIGKHKMFEPQTNDWYVKNKGETFKFVEGTLTLKTGERSLFLALSNGVDLTEDEAFAIVNSDIEFTHREVSNKGEKLAALLKIANQMTILNSKL